MDELKKVTDELVSLAPDRVILSNPRPESEFIKVVLSPKTIKNQTLWQAEQYTATQVFHRNMSTDEMRGYIEGALGSVSGPDGAHSDSPDKTGAAFRQADVFSPAMDMTVRITKKGKVQTGRHIKKQNKGARTDIQTGARTGNKPDSRETKSVPLPVTASHNRRKNRLIEEGTVVPPLVDMGIFTREGKIVKSMGDKFRQINRFLEIIDDAVEAAGFRDFTIVDFGCGKAYLTFVVYYYLNEVKGLNASMIGLDLKADVISKCNAAAEKYGYDHLHFEVGDISEYTAKGPIDMVVTLHACDTATDYALYNAVTWGTRVILSVPCCQHELNAQISSDSMNALMKYGIIKERFAALSTDALRASLLESVGYKTQVLEFVDLSHTPKNLLIRAVKTNVSGEKRRRSLSEARSLIQEFHADPTLYRLLDESGRFPEEKDL